MKSGIRSGGFGREPQVVGDPGAEPEPPAPGRTLKYMAEANNISGGASPEVPEVPEVPEAGRPSLIPMRRRPRRPFSTVRRPSRPVA